MSKPDISTSFSSVLALLWPQILVMYVLCAMSVAPVWAAGHMSPSIQAALGVSLQIIFFLNVVSIAINAGATAVISQSIGAGRIIRAKLFVGVTILTNLLLGLLVAFIATLFGKYAFLLLGLSGTELEIATKLCNILFLSLPFAFAFNSGAVIFRSFRQVKTPLVITIFACALQITLLYTLCVGENSSFMGIAWAHFYAQVFGAVASFLALYFRGHLHFALPKKTWLFGALPRLFSTALHSGATSLLWQGGNLTLYIIVGHLPLDATASLAGLSAGNRIESFLFMAGTAFNMCASVVVGNALGAGRLNEARRVGAMLTFGGALIFSFVAMILWGFMDELSALMSDDKIVQKYAVSYLAYNFASTPFSLICVIFAGVMIGASAAHFNLIIFGACFWLIRIPLAWYLGHHLVGDASGVFMAMLISQIVQAGLMSYVFFKLPWWKKALRT